MGFLGSEFITQIYADWPIERRVDGYLTHRGLMDVVEDGFAYREPVQRVMVINRSALHERVFGASATSGGP